MPLQWTAPLPHVQGLTPHTRTCLEDLRQKLDVFAFTQLQRVRAGLLMRAAGREGREHLAGLKCTDGMKRGGTYDEEHLIRSSYLVHFFNP